MNKRRKVESDSNNPLGITLSTSIRIGNLQFDEYITNDLLAIITEFIGDCNMLNYMLINKRFYNVINDDQYDCFRHFEYEIPFTKNPPKNLNLIRKLRICSIDEDVYDFDEEIALMKFNKLVELIVLDECSESFPSVCDVIEPSRVKILSINFAVNSDILKTVTESFTNVQQLFISDFEDDFEIETKIPSLTHFKLREDLDYSTYSYDPFKVDEWKNFFCNFTPNLKSIEIEPNVGYMKLENLIEICSKVEFLEFIKVGIVLKNDKIDNYPSLKELQRPNKLKLDLYCYSEEAMEILTKYFENFKERVKITFEDRESIQKKLK